MFPYHAYIILDATHQIDESLFSTWLHWWTLHWKYFAHWPPIVFLTVFMNVSTFNTSLTKYFEVIMLLPYLLWCQKMKFSQCISYDKSKGVVFPSTFITYISKLNDLTIFVPQYQRTSLNILAARGNNTHISHLMPTNRLTIPC